MKLRRFLRGLALASLASIAAVLSSCGGAQRSSAAGETSWRELRFRAAALPARRASGAPWHSSGGDNTAAVLGGLIGLAVGYPEVGFALGSSLVSEPVAEAPAPTVVVKIEGETYSLSPIGQTLAPRWSQPIAIPSRRHRGDAPALIQILDALDHGVLGQRQLRVEELLAPGARTLTDLGDVASLDLEVRELPARRPATFSLYVDGARSLEELKAGADRRWLPIPVWNGDRITLEVSGEICPSRPTPCFDAGGAEPGRWRSYNYSLFADAPHASLVGILPGRQLVTLGASPTFVAEQAGFLLLFVNDTDEGNNAGGFDVLVHVEPAR
jgi:hypothetical protein